MMSVFVFADAISMFWSMVVSLYLPSVGFNISNYSSVSCSLFVYLSRVIQQVPLFFQAFIYFVNYLSVQNYSRYIDLTRRKLNLILSFRFIVFFLLVINSPSAIRYIIVQNGTQSCKKTNLVDIVSTINNSVWRSIVPFIVINTFEHTEFSSLDQTKNRMTCKRIARLDDEKRFAKVLVVNGLVVFIFNCPVSCIDLVYSFYQYGLNY